MFWLDRDRGKPGASDSNVEEPSAAQPEVRTPPAQGQRGPAPHVVVSGRQLREEILSYGPAFLEPHRFTEPDAFRALVTVLAAYALGSRTAARLVRERQMADPSWQPPSRREAMQVVSSLNRLRQYLPYLIGQRIQVSQGVAAPPPPPPPAAQYAAAPPPPPPAAQYAAPPPPPPAAQYAAPPPPPPAAQYPPPTPRSGYCPSPTPPPPPSGEYQQPGMAPATAAYPNGPTSYYPPPTPQATPVNTSPGYGQVESGSHGSGVNNFHATEMGMHTPRPVRISQPPQQAASPAANARPAPPRTSGVVVRPVISLNRRDR